MTTMAEKIASLKVAEANKKAVATTSVNAQDWREPEKQYIFHATQDYIVGARFLYTGHANPVVSTYKPLELPVGVDKALAVLKVVTNILKAEPVSTKRVRFTVYDQAAIKYFASLNYKNVSPAEAAQAIAFDNYTEKDVKVVEDFIAECRAFMNRSDEQKLFFDKYGSVNFWDLKVPAGIKLEEDQELEFHGVYGPDGIQLAQTWFTMNQKLKVHVVPKRVFNRGVAVLDSEGNQLTKDVYYAKRPTEGRNPKPQQVRNAAKAMYKDLPKRGEVVIAEETLDLALEM